MELEVAVEKNQGMKAFSFSPTGSHEALDEDIFSSGDGPPQRNFHTKSEPISAQLLPKLPPPIFKIAVIGDSTVGKTAICEAFCKKNFTSASKYIMTCGVQIYGKCLSSHWILGNNEEPGKYQPEEKINLILLDSAGKELYRDYLLKYWEKLDSVVLVLDLTSPASLETSYGWMELIQNSLTSNFAVQTKKIGVLIGNKADLKDQRLISSDAAQALASEFNLEYFECSVRNNSGLDEPFQFIGKQWLDVNGQNRSTKDRLTFRGQGSDGR